jgi:hypothetical protein
MHTYDQDNLLKLIAKIERRDGIPLAICIPDGSSDGPLFARQKNITEPISGD